MLLTHSLLFLPLRLTEIKTYAAYRTCLDLALGRIPEKIFFFHTPRDTLRTLFCKFGIRDTIVKK